MKHTRLTVAKICHELANHLSVIQFLRDDLSERKDDEFMELCRGIDCLSLTLRFFRNIYLSNGDVECLVNIVIDLFKATQLVLSDKNNILRNIVNSPKEKVVCGALYIMMKTCKIGDEISIDRVGNNGYEIVIQSVGRTLPSGAIAALSDNDVQEDVFNVFVMYIKDTARLAGLNLKIDKTFNDFLRMLIWKE